MSDYRQCDTDHIRDYPGCYEECDHDKCVAGEPAPDPAPMTGKPMRGKIADHLIAYSYWLTSHYESVGQNALEADRRADAILAIREIKEGQELREKVKILHGHGGVADQIRQCLAGAGADIGSLSLGDKFAKDRLGAWLQRIQVEVLRIESLASGESR